MNSRYMDPKVGIFITPDPSMSGLNLYAYCNSNPINYTDPTGLYYDSVHTRTIMVPVEKTMTGEKEVTRTREVVRTDADGNEYTEVEEYTEMVTYTYTITVWVPETITEHDSTGASEESTLDSFENYQYNKDTASVNNDINSTLVKNDPVKSSATQNNVGDTPGIDVEGDYSVIGGFNDDYRNIGQYAHHEGFDKDTPKGTNIIANKELNIVFKNDIDYKGYGKYIVGQDTSNSKIFYLGAHLSSINATIGLVKQGTILGQTGDSGGVTAHFHGGTYNVPSGLLHTATKEDGGLFYGKNWSINQDYAVNSYNNSETWGGSSW